MTTTAEKKTNEYGQPAWIIEPISPYDLAGILENERPYRKVARDHEPLDSGCYIPAVEYETARKTMEEHGDDVLDYLQEVKGRIPTPDMSRYSWHQLPCFFLSRAVLAWAEQHKHLADWENDEPIQIS